MNNIELKAIKELMGMNFYIPNYQRGYRWNHQQVKDLLEDIKEFMDANRTNIYCIQPLVVKRSPIGDGLLNDIRLANSIEEVRELINKSDVWEVIDGQQRLTTIYILLKYLLSDNDASKNLYSIEYATRSKSRDFLEKEIEKYNKENIDNIDFFHMGEAYCVVKEWFSEIESSNRQRFLQTLLDRVKFIWYEVDEKQNSKEIFQRLNLGKISLTNSELIKAIFLRRNQDASAADSSIMQISTEWDIIENALQNDELWAFVNTLDYESPTRIDYIFDIIRTRDIFNQSNSIDVGNDEYSTFRYFYAYLKDKKDLSEVWSKVYEVYDILNEWYNTSNLYHYIGFIIANTNKKSCEVVSDLIKAWLDENTNKEQFIKNNLLKTIKKICKLDKYDLKQCLEKNFYDMEGWPSKTECRPLLLLHNIETIVRQNKYIDATSKFGNVFYRFPYHLYKTSRKNIGWDVEHIDSNTENELRYQNDRREYLKLAYLGTTDESIKQNIRTLLSKDNIDDDAFDLLRKNFTDGNHLSSEEKNQIWNFALLDAKTNRGYGNAPFPAKRRVIIGKEQGIKYSVDEKNNFEERRDLECVTFIPPCTRNAFLKYYTAGQATNLTAWLREDAEAYRDNMLLVIGNLLKMIGE